MNYQKILKIKKKKENSSYKSGEGQKGISLFLTIIILAILLAISLGVSTILFGQIKTIGEIGKSITAFYAADTGTERMLYENKLCLVDCPPLCPIDCGAEENPCPPGCDLENLGCEHRENCPCPCSGCAGWPDSCDGLQDNTQIEDSLGGYSDYEAIFFTWSQISIIQSVGKYQGVQRAIETTIR
jgi:hypothetical protein